MSKRVTAADRFARIVSIVPWVAERDGPTIDEICERFSLSAEELRADLDVVFMVGVPPYTPDELIDVIIEGGRVWIEMGDYFKRPLRLTTTEALGLLVSASALVDADDGAESEVLRVALSKLRTALGARGEGALSVELGDVDPGVLGGLRSAVTEGRRQRISYYSHASDVHSERVVDPQRVYLADGNWYLLAWCHLAGAERVFRVDRIGEASETGESFDPEPGAAVSVETTYRSGVGERRIVLEIEDLDSWVLDEYPAESIERVSDERSRVTIKVAGVAFAERLLLTLGPSATVVEAYDEHGAASDVGEWVATRSAAAERLAARYPAPTK